MGKFLLRLLGIVILFRECQCLSLFLYRLPTVDTDLSFLVVSSLPLRAHGRIYLGRVVEKVSEMLWFIKKCVGRKGWLSEQKLKQRDLRIIWIWCFYLVSLSFSYLITVLKGTNEEKYDNADCGGLKPCPHILWYSSNQESNFPSLEYRLTSDDENMVKRHSDPRGQA